MTVLRLTMQSYLYQIVGRIYTVINKSYSNIWQYYLKVGLTLLPLVLLDIVYDYTQLIAEFRLGSGLRIADNTLLWNTFWGITSFNVLLTTLSNFVCIWREIPRSVRASLIRLQQYSSVEASFHTI